MKSHLDKKFIKLKLKFIIVKTLNIIIIIINMGISHSQFHDYITKVLNTDEIEFFKEYLINYGTDKNKLVDLHKFPMFYMKNMEITTDNLKKNKNDIYFLVDPYRGFVDIFRQKLSMDALHNKIFSLCSIDFLETCNKVGYTIMSYNDTYDYGLSFKNKCVHIHNAIKQRLYATFLLLNHVCITDIAIYIWQYYYDVIFC